MSKNTGAQKAQPEQEVIDPAHEKANAIVAESIEAEEPKQLAQAPTRPTAVAPFRGEIESLISQAIDKNVPVETMEKLLAMRRELKQEQAKEAYDRAMAKLQRELPVIEKNKQAGDDNSKFKYNYSPLEFIIEKTKKIIADNGFSYYFDTEEDGSYMTIYCHTTHEAGYTKTSKFKLPIDKGARMNATQQYGSALTYGKRYCFCDAFGIVVGGEDNDAQTLGDGTAPKNTQNRTQTKAPAGNKTADLRLISAAQIRYIRNLLNTKGYTEKQLLKKYKKSKMEDFTRDDATAIITGLNKLPDNPSDQPDPAPAETEGIDYDEVDKGIEQQRLERDQK